MISVQNHRLLLNGSKIFVIAVLLSLSLSACELFKPISQGTEERDNGKKEELEPIQGRRVYDPATGTYVIIQNAPTGSMDTIIWRNIPIA